MPRPFPTLPNSFSKPVDLWNLQCRSMEVQWSHLQQSPAPSPEALCGLICKVRALDLSSTWKRFAFVIFHQISRSQKQKISRYHLHLPFCMDGSSRLCCSGNLPIISQQLAPLMVLKAVLPTPARHKQAPPRWQEAPIAGYIGSKPHGWIPWRFFWFFFCSQKPTVPNKISSVCQKSWGFCKKKPNVLLFPEIFRFSYHLLLQQGCLRNAWQDPVDHRQIPPGGQSYNCLINCCPWNDPSSNS